MVHKSTGKKMRFKKLLQIYMKIFNLPKKGCQINDNPLI
jgi:hypothetical protein